MSKDISSILAGWDHEPNEMQVRIVAGDDGRDKIQMRVDLGVLQMELEGRPDGQRPEGFETLLDWFEHRVENGEALELDGDECAELMREGVQFYHRYLASFHLQRYDVVARDTTRNLRLFRFVVEHAANRRDKVQFDQYRPYVTMMRARALGLQALAKDDHATAMERVDEGIAAIRAFLVEYGQADNEAECMELVALLRWKRDVEKDRPIGPLDRLREQLARAVALEDYEEAARVRDQLRRLQGDDADAVSSADQSSG